MFLFKTKTKEQKAEEKGIQDFEDKFYDEMFQYGLLNKFNDTYNLKIYNKTLYGYYAHLYRESGLPFSKLEPYINDLEENLNCLWIMKYEKFSEYADIKIVTKPLDESFQFEDPKLKPHEIYLGVDMSYQVIKANINTYCMVLIGGATRSGKTRFIYCMLLSWILNNSPQKVELYLNDIAKNEYIQFKNVRHVRYYADDLDKMYAMMCYLKNKITERKNILSRTRETGRATNIEEFNRIARPGLSYIYVLVDEFSVLNIESSDDKDEKFKKQVILNTIKLISKIGGGLGIFVIDASQKTSKDEVPAVIKNMSTVRISFRANDDASSEVILGDTGAKGLLQRYAKYSLNGGGQQDLLYTPNLSIPALKKLLEPHIDKNFKRPIIELPPDNKEPGKANKKPKKDTDKAFTGHSNGNKKNY